MSPAAAAFASACSAPGPLAGVAVVAGGDVLAGAGVPVVAVGLLAEPPQPAPTTASISTAEPRASQRTVPVSSRLPESRLNARQARAEETSSSITAPAERSFAITVAT